MTLDELMNDWNTLIPKSPIDMKGSKQLMDTFMSDILGARYAPCPICGDDVGPIDRRRLAMSPRRRSDLLKLLEVIRQTNK